MSIMPRYREQASRQVAWHHSPESQTTYEGLSMKVRDTNGRTPGGTWQYGSGVVHECMGQQLSHVTSPLDIVQLQAAQPQGVQHVSAAVHALPQV